LFTPPRQAGANKHSANACLWLSLSFLGIFHHPNLGFKSFQATAYEQSPPGGHGSHVQFDGLDEVLLRYMSFSSLQISMVFQLRLVQEGDPSSGCSQPAGQVWHSELGNVFCS
jgi:hypothetical protein